MHIYLFLFSIKVCPKNTNGIGCGYCNDGFFGDPFETNELNHTCQQCYCDKNGSQNILCSHDGMCSCKAGFIGDKCNLCLPGFFPFPDCNTGILILYIGYFI